MSSMFVSPRSSVTPRPTSTFRSEKTRTWLVLLELVILGKVWYTGIMEPVWWEGYVNLPSFCLYTILRCIQFPLRPSKDVRNLVDLVWPEVEVPWTLWSTKYVWAAQQCLNSACLQDVTTRSPMLVCKIMLLLWVWACFISPNYNCKHQLFSFCWMIVLVSWISWINAESWT